MAFRLAADAVLLLHVAFILFVILGAAIALRWRWAVVVHLPAAVWGFFVELTGDTCPLTYWENYLRVKAGQSGYAESFIEHYLLALIYPAGLTREIQFALAGIVIIVNVAIYGWLLSRRGSVGLHFQFLAHRNNPAACRNEAGRAMRIPHTVGRIMRCLWAAPCTAVGLCLVAPAFLFGASAHVVKGVVEVAVSTHVEAGVLLRLLPFNAITFGHVVIATTGSELNRLRAHEHEHVKQYERWGALFFLVYPLASLWQLLRGRRPYTDNWFEVQARARESSRSQ